jgi:HK97 family phage prohead protease
MTMTDDRMERRFLNLQVRAMDEDQKKYIAGDAAVFFQETVIGDYFREMVKPGAFKRVLSERPDVIAAYNHDWNVVLARTTNGTLSLEETDAGLSYKAEINPNDPEALSVYEKVKRGDVPQASFAFTVRSEEWVHPAKENELPLRILTEIGELYDVGPCTFGAYPQASAQARSKASEFQLKAVPAEGQEIEAGAEVRDDLQEQVELRRQQLKLLKLKNKS